MPYTHPSIQDSYRRLVHFCALTALLVHLALIAIFACNGFTWLAWFNAWSLAMHARALWLSHPGGNVQRAADCIGLEVAINAIVTTLMLGWDSGFHYLMIPMVPVYMLSNQHSRRMRLGLAVVTGVIYIVLKLWSSFHTPLYQAPMDMLHTLEFSCLLTLFLAFMALSTRYHDIVAEAQDMLAREASTDPLTGALNRRRLTQLATELPPEGYSALLLCDIDHFKRVNDRYGHDAGDTVLQHFYRQMLTCTRSGDHVSRWGGEEFLVLLPQTSSELARQVAQRLRDTTAATPIVIAPGQQLHITVTIGLAYLWPGESLQAAILRADAALYRGKASGRNQVQEHAGRNQPLEDAEPVTLASHSADLRAPNAVQAGPGIDPSLGPAPS